MINIPELDMGETLSHRNQRVDSTIFVDGASQVHYLIYYIRFVYRYRLIYLSLVRTLSIIMKRKRKGPTTPQSMQSLL